ncbi:MULTISPECIES: methyltransferase [Sphingobium]|uniref:methyltransferase n=1 Tax=Sphingobium TaxID=165695 RepID=UPI0015EC690A|nr:MULTISPECIES: methyltransferase [Sphingobium]MCW2361389.1 putative SAM-dependent methyltransferase [Sphingobium sp. B10D3B]MCW2401932.1 putative SAM-dependent methyltransferase [Sphingobium sp. B10D7B]MCW2408911.1 putative SAM-dependent methyltransferase [Sphingobium xanthum]
MLDLSLTKINVGCGYDKRLGHLNVDMDPACDPDFLVVDNGFSGLPRKHFDTLVSYDVLEHIQRAETTNALLEWADLLSAGGVLDLETSNVVAIAEMIKSVRVYERHSTYTTFMYGNQAHPGDFHHTGFTDITLRVHVTAAGFEIEEFSQRDTWLYCLKARKVLDWTALLDQADLSNEEFVFRAYADALDRTPEEPFLSANIAMLDHTADRRGFLKMLWGSEERRLRIAQRLGF